MPYGPDAEQILDLYLPKNESTRVEKVIVLLHGAAWGAGDKEDFASVPILREVLPNFVVANMNYRLGKNLIRQKYSFTAIPSKLIYILQTILNANFKMTTYGVELITI